MFVDYDKKNTAKHSNISLMVWVYVKTVSVWRVHNINISGGIVTMVTTYGVWRKVQTCSSVYARVCVLIMIV